MDEIKFEKIVLLGYMTQDGLCAKDDPYDWFIIIIPSVLFLISFRNIHYPIPANTKSVESVINTVHYKIGHSTVELLRLLQQITCKQGLSVRRDHLCDTPK